jgi:hypothetical protein
MVRLKRILLLKVPSISRMPFREKPVTCSFAGLLLIAESGEVLFDYNHDDCGIRDAGGF